MSIVYESLHPNLKFMRILLLIKIRAIVRYGFWAGVSIIAEWSNIEKIFENYANFIP